MPEEVVVDATADGVRYIACAYPRHNRITERTTIRVDIYAGTAGTKLLGDGGFSRLGYITRTDTWLPHTAWAALSHALLLELGPWLQEIA